MSQDIFPLAFLEQGGGGKTTTTSRAVSCVNPHWPRFSQTIVFRYKREAIEESNVIPEKRAGRKTHQRGSSPLTPPPFLMMKGEGGGEKNRGRDDDWKESGAIYLSLCADCNISILLWRLLLTWKALRNHP